MTASWRGVPAESITGTLPSARLPTITHVRAKRTTAFTVPDSTETVIAFNAKDYDTLTELDVATNVGRFTAIAAGYYKVNAAVQLTSADWTAGNLVRMAVSKNGTALIFEDKYVQASATIPMPAKVSTTLLLAAGDYVEVTLYHDKGTDGVLPADSRFHYVTIDRLF